MTVLALGLAAMLFTAAAVAAYLPVARRRGWVDTPNHRSSHQRPTPNSGGVVAIPVFLAVVSVSALIGVGDGSGARAVSIPELLSMLGLTALLCATGAVDDRRHLSAGVRLLAFLLACSVLVVIAMAPRTAGAWILAAVLSVALAWLVNLYNFMDGLDGIAALQCVLVSTMLAAIAHAAGASPVYLGVASVLAGSFLAFLFFNWPPAALFMGDAGSLSAGFVLGWLGLAGWREGWVPATVWVLLMSPFLLDTTLTLLFRLQRRAPLAQAHREHFYQRLARHWRSHRAVILALLALHLLWLQPLVLLQLRYPAQALTILLLGLFPQLLLMVSLRRLQ